MSSKPHTLDQREVDPKMAVPRGESSGGGGGGSGGPPAVSRTKKVFVGGLAPDTTEQQLREFFEQYGRVEEAMLMFDGATKRPRGFGFVTFESEDVVDKVGATALRCLP